MAPSGLKNKTRFRAQVLAALIEAGLLEMTDPGQAPKLRQQYRTTAAGRELLKGQS